MSRVQDIDTEQVSLFLGKGYVLTFQEKTEDVFDPIRQRLKQNLGRLRKNGADYLFYALVDTIVKNYFRAIESIEDRIDELEERVYGEVSKEIIQDIQHLKRTLIFLRKSVFPLREVINQLGRTHDHQFIQKKTADLFSRCSRSAFSRH